MGRQGDLLEPLEPGPTMTPAIRRAVVPMLAALLLEAAPNPTEDGADVTVKGKEAGDEQDRS